ncbi:hypothetical protein LY90DRAFT_663814 [Neocallimastix californiae]|uniref:Uncharacterized protein n=1 Tax=Neocallimastix californiae TaxID=1754190 RepID=A0A1Y2FHE2_9FUNG|nr:hypothetical protein LY90DRAFT_663814 [Neocallimastix californiae]|eukprot:ORY83381.1 hypothetical protein LY90DRAFT_663814 [Neocallimastix californiae]
MEDLQNLHYIKKKELSALDHKFYDDSDEYRLKKRKELYEKPIDKENFSIYSKSSLTNYDTIESETNPITTFRRDYTRKSSDRRENLQRSKEMKDDFKNSHIDFLQDYKRDKDQDFNNESNSKCEKEKDDGLSRCYDKAHLDKDTDEVYKHHFLTTMVHDYTKKTIFSLKRDPIDIEKLNKFKAINKDNNELNKKKHSTYEHDYYPKTLNQEPHRRLSQTNNRTRTNFKLEDYNGDLSNPYSTEVKDNYKPYSVDRVIGAPNTIKHYFITNPDYTEDPFKTSMKTDFPLYDQNQYHKEDPCEKQDKAQFDLGLDDTDNCHTLYKDSYNMTNDTIKETYKNSKKIPNYTTKDNINLDRENEGYRDLTSVHRIDYKKDPTANSKAYKDSKYIFDGIKEISTGIPLNLTWETDRVNKSLMQKDYSTPEVNDENRFKKVDPATYDTNLFLKTNNKQKENDNDPKLSIFKTDFVNYPNKYKVNPRRPPNYNFNHHLFHGDVYDDENSPMNYGTSYDNDYQKINNPKQSVTHKNFNAKNAPPVEHAKKYDVEKLYVNIIEHNYTDNSNNNNNISIAHSSYIAPEITIVIYNYYKRW